MPLDQPAIASTRIDTTLVSSEKYEIKNPLVTRKKIESSTFESNYLATDPYIGESLQNAYIEISAGNSTKAVKLLSDTFVYLLQEQPHLIQSCLKQNNDLSDQFPSWPSLGADLVIKNHNISIAYQKDSFSPSDASAYFEFYLKLNNSMIENKSPLDSSTVGRRSSVPEAIDTLIHFLSTRITTIGQRSLIEILALLRGSCFFESQGNRASKRILATKLSFYLREPVKECRRKLTKHVVEMLMVNQRRKRIMSPAEMASHRKSFYWLQEREYIDFSKNSSRSRILVTYHFGDYSGALNRILESTERNRKHLLIRKVNDGSNFLLNTKMELRDMGVDGLTIASSEEITSREIVSFLRKKRTVLFIFCDLSRQHGRVTKVDFLGRKAYFPMGPAHLAVTSKALILPVITFNNKGNNIIVMDRIIDPTRRHKASLRETATHVTQKLIYFLEYYLRLYPEQWQFYTNLAGYFLPENGIDVMHSSSINVDERKSDTTTETTNTPIMLAQT